MPPLANTRNVSSKKASMLQAKGKRKRHIPFINFCVSTLSESQETLRSGKNAILEEIR